MSIISEKLENMRNYLDVEVHPVVSPDRWDVYSTLCDMVDDIIALLKTQVPRVMTLEEIDTAPAGYMVLQTRDMRDMLGWYDGLLFSVNVNWTVDIITLEGKKRLSKDDYGKTWRCWTSRPTDAQRAAEPWPKEEP